MLVHWIGNVVVTEIIRHQNVKNRSYELFAQFTLTTDISRYYITRYCTQHNNFEGKNSGRRRTHEIHPYLALTGELWVSFVSYLKKNDRDISATHCIRFEVVGKVKFNYIIQGYFTRTGTMLQCLCINSKNEDYHLNRQLNTWFIDWSIYLLLSDTISSFIDLSVNWIRNVVDTEIIRHCNVILKTKALYAQNDVIKWKHFPRYWPFVRGIHRSPVNSPHRGLWYR